MSNGTAPRPTRSELVQKMFPELQKATGSVGDKEAAIGLNTRAAEAILGDLIGLFDAGYSAQGPGVLALRLTKAAVTQDSEYLTSEDIQQDLELAERTGDQGIAGKLNDVAKLIESHNPSKAALLMVIDSGMRVFQVDRDNPAAALTSMMEGLQQ